jgi:hypothetical protein
VRNLRTGKVLHKVPTGPSSEDEVGGGPVAALVVKSDGAVAWVAGAGGASSLHEVFALDESGKRLLASGLEIEPKSLKLRGNLIYWKQGGKQFSAPLS